MKKLIYIAMTVFISLFALSCENEEKGLIGTWVGMTEEEDDDLVEGNILRMDYTLVLSTSSYTGTFFASIPDYPEHGWGCTETGDYTTTDTEINFFGNHRDCTIGNDDYGEGYENDYEPSDRHGTYVLSEETLTITYTETDESEEEGNEEVYEQEYTIIFTRQ